VKLQGQTRFAATDTKRKKRPEEKPMSSRSELIPLQGVWRFLVIEADGHHLELTGDQAITVIIEGDEWVSPSPDSDGVWRTRFALDPARHRFDFQPAPGVVSPGIYCLDGPRLQLCVNQRALKRALGQPIEGDEYAAPPEFSAPAGSGYRLWILERPA
jgi:uncharacterized protein (TIGR03067 family)